MKRKRLMIQTAIATASVFITVFGLRMFNQYFLLKIPLFPRMAFMIISQWTLFLVPGLLMLMQKEKLRDIGFSREGVPKQIILGLLLALPMSAILTVLPILLGLKDMVGNFSYTQVWQFVFQFVYSIGGVALAEELVFRGYLFQKLLEIRNSRWFAIIGSSVLFGLFHVFSGNPVQVLMTAIIGLIYCVYREKVRDCSLLSLIIAHGLYDGMIVL